MAHRCPSSGPAGHPPSSPRNDSSSDCTCPGAKHSQDSGGRRGAPYRWGEGPRSPSTHRVGVKDQGSLGSGVRGRKPGKGLGFAEKESVLRKDSPGPGDPTRPSLQVRADATWPRATPLPSSHMRTPRSSGKERPLGSPATTGAGATLRVGRPARVKSRGDENSLICIRVSGKSTQNTRQFDSLGRRQMD